MGMKGTTGIRGQVVWEIKADLSGHIRWHLSYMHIPQSCMKPRAACCFITLVLAQMDLQPEAIRFLVAHGCTYSHVYSTTVKQWSRNSIAWRKKLSSIICKAKVSKLSPVALYNRVKAERRGRWKGYRKNISPAKENKSSTHLQCQELL